MPFRGLFNRYTDDGFQAATITSTVAPLSTYALTTLQANDPAQRVLFGNVTVTITWTLGSAIRGDVFVLPMSNLAPGTGVATLTNGAGLSVPITVPAKQANGIANTLVVDLVTAVPNVVTRTSTIWNLVVVSNSAAFIMGGAAALYNTMRVLPLGFRREFSPKKQQATSVEFNEYFTAYRVNYTTSQRVIECTIVVASTDLDDMEAWYDANAGNSLPGFLWPGNAELDKYFGLWHGAFEPKRLGDASAYEIPLTFLELSKGKPI